MVDTDRLTNTIENWLWAPAADASPQFGRWFRSVFRVLYLVARDLMEGTLTLRAMSLVYTTLLSTVPLLAFSFSVLKGFGVHNQLEPVLFNVLEPLGERGETLAGEIIGFVDNMDVGVLGAVGLALLVYTVISLMQKIEASFHQIWRVSTRRSFGERFSDYMSVLLVGPVLVFAALGVTGSILHTDWVERIAAVEPMRTLVVVGSALVPYALVIGAFTFVYVFVPHTRVRFRSALVGALVAGVLWETAGWGFASFIAGSTKYTAIYSGFAIMILAMIWIYLAWLILLIGAGIAFYHQYPQYRARRPGSLRLSIRATERLAIAALVAIGRHFVSGQEPLSVRQLATDLAAPLPETEFVLGALAAHDLVRGTSNQPPRFVPGRPLDLITLADVLSAVRRHPNGTDAGGENGDTPHLTRMLDAVTDMETALPQAKTDLRRLLAELDEHQVEMQRASVPQDHGR